MNIGELLELTEDGPDTFFGGGPKYPWGGLYGGQIVAQALRAAAATVEPHFEVHSLRAYFIRRGDHEERVRYDVDRIRDGRSFCTRRVVAVQEVGAILNLEASFHVPESGFELQPIASPMRDADPSVTDPGALPDTSWSPSFQRSFVPNEALAASPRAGRGRVVAWLRTADALADDQLLQRCAMAFLSDDLPTDAVVRAHPLGREDPEVLYQSMFSASLDHTIWFHRPMRADEWHLHDFVCQSFTSGRGLSAGQIFDLEGNHVASVAQEVLLRDVRSRERA